MGNENNDTKDLTRDSSRVADTIFLSTRKRAALELAG